MHKAKTVILCAAAVLGASIVYAQKLPVPTVGEVKTFKDWTVGCDNVLACQAVALVPENAAGEALGLVVRRGEAIGAPVELQLSGAQAKADRYRLSIDGRTVSSGTIQRDSDFIRIVGADARRLARQIGVGRTIQLTGGDGANLGSASLAGASAALRYIDSRQGRAGTQGAIIATGRRKAAAKRVSVPVISIRKIVPTDQLPGAAELVALSESSPCAGERFGSTEDTAYSLGTGPRGAQALVLLNCGAGAYNFSSGIYVGERSSAGKWSFAPARFDYGATGFSADSKIPLLVNADWDAATQSISSYAKGRGLGDCGSSESWVWDGTGFRLTRATVMGECRGSVDWIPVWRAEVRFVT